MIGTRISHFEIIRLIGQGGMGVVYLAEDQRLNRPVAIKLLPSEVIDDKSALERFENEIRATSILSHPVICQVLDVGTFDGKPFMVMEYLEGASIRQLLRERSFTPTEVLQLAIELADALDSAHEHHIIHRDIKPGNIFLSDRNHPKLLDFGLAKISSELFDISDIGDDTPTKKPVVEDVTGTGVTMGTVLYMSPEQARGEVLDARTDLFSLGAVLYEMTTRVKPFPGETSALVFDSILNKNTSPPSQIGGPSVEMLDKVILKLLEKNPNHRFQSAKALRAELLRIARDQGLQVSSSRYAISVPAPKRVNFLSATIGTLALFAIIALIRFQFHGDSPTFSQPTPEPEANTQVIDETSHAIIPLTTEPGREDTPSVSPNGGRVAYSSSGLKGKNTDIYVKLTQGGNPLRLTNHPDADVHPTWSPDGQRIAFVRKNSKRSQIIVVPTLGGTPEIEVVTIDENHTITTSLSWLHDSQHIVYERWKSEFDSEIRLVNIHTKESETLVAAPENGGRHYSAAVAPDGRSMAFVRDEGVGNGSIFLFDFRSLTSSQITDEVGHIMGITWTPDSQKIIYAFSQGGSSLIYAVDREGGIPSGVPGVGPRASFPSMAANASVLAYVTNQSSQDIWRFSVSPKINGLKSAGYNFLHSSLNDYDLLFNKDETLISFISDRSGTAEIWTTDAERSPPIKVTNIESGYVFNPVWSPDNEHFLFTSTHLGGIDVFSIPTEGGAIMDVSGDDVTSCLIGTWSADGKAVYYMALGSIWRRDIETGEATEIVKDGWQAIEQPEENQLYYSRLIDSGKWQLYRRELNEANPENPGELVSDKITLPMPVNWFLRHGGIYYLGDDIAQSVHISKNFNFYDAKTDEVVELGVIENLPQLYHMLEMSDDGEFVYAPQLIDENRDIIVIEQVQGL